MWKKLLAAGAVLAGCDSPSLAFGKKQVALPSGVLQGYRSSAADPLGIGTSAGDRLCPKFATPLPPGPGRVSVPKGAPLAAPIITPLAATEVGHRGRKFEVIPAGVDEKPLLTKHPEKFVDPCADQCAPRTWANFEFLYWATQGVQPSPVITSGPAFAAPGVAGTINQVGTVPLFGASNTLNQFRPGFRIEAGHWFDAHPGWGVSARFYFLGAVSEQFIGGSNGVNILVYNSGIITPQGTVYPPITVAYPGLTNGSAIASVHSNFLGGDVNLRHRVSTHHAIELDVLAGYRTMHLGDNLVASFDTVSATVPANQTWRALGEDRVATQNQFHGGQVGFASTLRRGQFTFGFNSSVALGVTVSDRDATRIRALSVVAAPLPLPVVPVAPAILSSSAQRSDFAVVPEVGLNFGWQPSDHVRFTFGYNFTYWSQVQRAQAVYDLTAVPAPGTTDFWAQGINWGLELRY